MALLCNVHSKKIKYIKILFFVYILHKMYCICTNLIYLKCMKTQVVIQAVFLGIKENL